MRAIKLWTVCCVAAMLWTAIAYGQPAAVSPDAEPQPTVMSLDDPALYEIPAITKVEDADKAMRDIIAKVRPLIKSPVDNVVVMRNMIGVYNALGDKVLALDAPNAKEKGYSLKMQGARGNTPESRAALATLADEMEKSGAVPNLVADARAMLFIAGLFPEGTNPGTLSPADRNAAFERITPLLAEQVQRYPSPQLRSVLQLLLSWAEKRAVEENNPALADAARGKFVALFASSDDPRLKKIAIGIEGEVRRSVGKVLDLKGITVDEKEFDWSAYKGKIVLIDFWASWCGPCIGEVPNMIKAYEQFKADGFEIVSVGVWETNDKHIKGMADHKMTWVSLSEDLTTKAAPEGTPKLSEYYGVQGIPTMFLVGRDGKILVTETGQIRGGKLVGTLEKILAEEKAKAK